MIRSFRITFLVAAAAILLVGVAMPASMAQTHSISGRIVIEGRDKYGGTVVWVDTLHVTKTDSLGNFEIAGFEDGAYAVKAWAERCLTRIVDTVQVAGRDVPGVNDTLFAGDVVEDRVIDLLDAGEILQHLHATPGSASWDASLDLDRSGKIDSLDLLVLMRHWKETDAVAPPSRIEVTAPDSAAFWRTGQRSVPISWKTGGLQGAVSIVLYRGGSPVDTITNSAPNSGSYYGYNVPVDVTPGTDYRVAVRLNDSNYGYSDYFEIGTAIVVTLPDSSTIWYWAQQDVPIHWTTANLSGPVEISLYEGNNFLLAISHSTPNNGSYTSFDVPNYPSSHACRVLVRHIDSGMSGFSDYFTIDAHGFRVTEPTKATVWSRGQKSVPVKWIKGNTGSQAIISLHKGAGTVCQWDGLDNSGTYLLDVPNNIPLGTDYSIEVSAVQGPSDQSGNFRIQDSSLTITTPDVNTVWMPGQQNVPIRWESSFLTGTVSIDLYQGDNLIKTIASSTPNDGEYSEYNVPISLAPGTDYSIRVDSDAGKHALSEHFGIDRPSGWVVQYPSPQGQDLYSVSFTDADRGTAVGDYGTILRTMDGGADWVVQWGSTRRRLNGVAFLDANTGLAVGEGGVILKTTDGGATWVGKRSGTKSALYSVAYADADTAVAAGWGTNPIVFCRTTDGGETWTPQDVNYFTTPHAVSFFNAKVGAAMGNADALYWTNDGGATWNMQMKGGEEWTQDRAGGIAVLDANTAIAVGWYCSRDIIYGNFIYSGVIYTTRNAGATWGTWNGGPSPLNAISCPDGHTATAVRGGRDPQNNGRGCHVGGANERREHRSQGCLIHGRKHGDSGGSVRRDHPNNRRGCHVGFAIESHAVQSAQFLFFRHAEGSCCRGRHIWGCYPSDS